MYRPTPSFVVSLVSLALIGFAILVVIKAHNHAIDRQAEEALKPTQGWSPPAIQCAYDGQPIWDCIRFVKTGDENETANTG
jgi:hypothetical protein